MEKQTNLFENGLVWFGAGVSLAEILTGTYFAGMGFGTAIAAILLGHLIGCTLLFLSGVIGGRQRLSSMESVKLDFGTKGGMFFAAMNVLQLLGWTAIMIYDGSLAAAGIFATPSWIWALVIGALILLWIFIGLENLGVVNTIAMAALFILTIVLCVVIFSGTAQPAAAGDALTFGAAVELAVAMPLSWLPLISDYTRKAANPVKAAAVSAIVYGLVSCWMYIIGMSAATLTGESDIAQIMLKAGLGIAGLVVVILSTVTTTFLDAWSAGISTESLFPKVSGRTVALVVAALGTLGACLFNMDDITNFLYLIGSVFAPMIAIQITDTFILRRKTIAGSFDIANCVIWVLGFVLYRVLMTVDIPVGNTFPTMLGVMCLCIIVHLVRVHVPAKK